MPKMRKGIQKQKTTVQATSISELADSVLKLILGRTEKLTSYVPMNVHLKENLHPFFKVRT